MQLGSIVYLPAGNSYALVICLLAIVLLYPQFGRSRQQASHRLTAMSPSQKESMEHFLFLFILTHLASTVLSHKDLHHTPSRKGQPTPRRLALV